MGTMKRRLLTIIAAVLFSNLASAQSIASAGACDVQSVAVDDAGRIWMAGGLYSPRQQSGVGTIAPGTECTTVTISVSSTMGQTWTEVWQSAQYRRATLWNISGKGMCAILSGEEGINIALWNDGWQIFSNVGKGVCSNPPVACGDDLYMPVSLDKSISGVYKSSDGGLTWTLMPGTFKTPEKVASDNQPSVVVGPDGKITLYTRSNGTSWSYMTSSSDYGQTWGKPSRFLPNPDREFAITRLYDGRLLLLRNGRLDQCLYILPEGLFAYLSDDEGKTWYGGLRLDNRSFSERPHVAAYPNGRMAIFFSHNFKGKNQICMAVTSVSEIDNASGSFKTTPRIAVPVMAAGLGEKTYADAVGLMNAPKSSWADKPLRVATYNIQYPADKAPAWKELRVPALKAVFDEYGFDVIGSQEPWKDQMEDLMTILGDDYAFVGANRNNDHSHPKSPYNPIFYRKSRVEMLEWGTFWFSDVPMTAGYGASSARFCTWAKFLDKATGKKFCHFNSHFDHLGQETRVYSVYILTDSIVKIAGGLPVFCTGDFNSNEKSRCYKEMLASGYLTDPLDGAEQVSGKEINSLHNYKDIAKNRKDGLHIDHVFYTPANSRAVSAKVVLDNNTKIGSDHLPIYMDWLIAD